MADYFKLLLQDKKYTITGLFLKACQTLDLTLNELYILIYLENERNTTFDPEKFSENLSIPANEILEAFNNLIIKKVITVETDKDADGRMIEKITLNGLEQIMTEMLSTASKEQKSSEIFSSFETEFGRTISPMEYEIINAWLSSGVSEELIIGALKEAVYNGAKSFRYIDKIIFSWKEKGFKNMSEVKKHLTTKTEKISEELFDYNWLEDDNDD